MSLHQPCPGRRSLAGLLGALTWSLEELVVERCYDLLTPAAFQAMGACKSLKARPKPKPNPKPNPRFRAGGAVGACARTARQACSACTSTAARALAVPP